MIYIISKIYIKDHVSNFDLNRNVLFRQLFINPTKVKKYGLDSKNFIVKIVIFYNRVNCIRIGLGVYCDHFGYFGFERGVRN